MITSDPNAAPDSSSPRPDRPGAGSIRTAFIFALMGLSVAVFVGLGRWLVVEDPLEKSQAIVVLSGRMPIRAVEAARLYRAGYAPQVWLTRPDEPTASMAAMGIADPGEDFFNARVLEHEGVPSAAIRVLDPPITNSADEMRAIASALHQENEAPVIIVTTKAHTRRIHSLWRRFSQSHARAIVRAASDDPFDPARWWRSTGDALDVLRELLGLANTWAGLPLSPSNR